MTSFASTLHLSNNVKSIKSLRVFRFSTKEKYFSIAPDQCGQNAHYQPPFSSSKTELALSEKSLTCRDLLDNKNKENLKIKMSLHIEQPKKTRPKFKESALKVNDWLTTCFHQFFSTKFCFLFLRRMQLHILTTGCLILKCAKVNGFEGYLGGLIIFLNYSAYCLVALGVVGILVSSISSISFQKSNIGWPQHDSLRTEKVLTFNMILVPFCQMDHQKSNFY